MEKCKKLRLMREEAQEVAELDIKNIISTKGSIIYGGLME